MKKNKRFIDCYMEWIKTGKLPKRGLCYSLPLSLSANKSFSLISPTIQECINNSKEGGGIVLWGISNYAIESSNDFTPLRQTIVLLCAVMEGEEF